MTIFFIDFCYIFSTLKTKENKENLKTDKLSANAIHDKTYTDVCHEIFSSLICARCPQEMCTR